MSRRRYDPFPDLPVAGEWTVDDLVSLPDDGRRYELFDGVLVVSPIPFAAHQRTGRALYRRLCDGCPPELQVFFGPVHFRPSRRRSFLPDLLVPWRVDVTEVECLHSPPALAVEIVSQSTRSLDLIFKPEMYVTSGVEAFWIFDPDLVEFTAYERAGGRYIETARASGGQRITVDQPYPVEICPAEIVLG